MSKLKHILIFFSPVVFLTISCKNKKASENTNVISENNPKVTFKSISVDSTRANTIIDSTPFNRQEKSDSSVKRNKQSVKSKNYLTEGFIKAKVIYYELDGCTFMIELENGKKLEPKNLPAKFKKNNLLVWIKYTNAKNTMSICMAGKPIEVTSIELRNQ